MVVFQASSTWKPRLLAQAPQFSLSPAATAMLLREGERRFYETYGYYFVESQDRISTVAIMYHFESSSTNNTTWSKIKSNLDVSGGAFLTASDLAVAIDQAMSGTSALHDVSLSIQVVATGVHLSPRRDVQFSSGPTKIENATRGVWDDAMRKSTAADAVPAYAHLASYRSLLISGHRWADYEGVPMTVQRRISTLKDSLQRLEKPVAKFPSATQQERFHREYASCLAAYSHIKGQ